MTSPSITEPTAPTRAATEGSRAAAYPLRDARPRSWPILAAAGTTVFLWASAFVGIRFAGHDYSPGAMALGRMVAASTALSAFVAFTTGVRRARTQRTVPRQGNLAARQTLLPRGGTLGLVALWGVAWFGGYNVALNAAERLVDAGTAALLVSVAPILVAVAAILVLGERLTGRLGVGVAIAFAGVTLIAAGGFTGHADKVGVALAVLSAVLYAFGVLLQKRLLARVDAVTMTWLGALAGTAALLPFAPTLVAQLAAAPLPATLGVLFLGVFPTAIGFLTWGYVLSRWTAGRTTAATYLVPPVAVLLSWTLLGEVPAPLALLGGALCLTGVVFATRR
ncbi:Threonine/homoserine efflux transporter RhtA [Micromonospora phaseoli]|uniref:Threonine/homoserine efflux transporter RhtA n=1 Tax=Micromonospora phaseoli TaxID=1144548 RepID=A0A1H6YS94_9ACTN|nr:DMT family transporter [Micromonospora phaseoli]PZW00294.1 threonine/homoserine efflux transporter RhtA [Micromonospora phaseoli]GIJ76771.1 membrane protein [Micromonospora phaseoli]SEJ42694.1 Threonine/homoserine efflux transporter RhtA [Micromonospora phaseoli]